MAEKEKVMPSKPKAPKPRLSIRSLLSGEYGAEQEQKRLKPPNNITGRRG